MIKQQEEVVELYYYYSTFKCMKAVIKYINSFLQQKPKRTKKEGGSSWFFFYSCGWHVQMYECMIYKSVCVCVCVCVCAKLDTICDYWPNVFSPE